MSPPMFEMDEDIPSSTSTSALMPTTGLLLKKPSQDMLPLSATTSAINVPMQSLATSPQYIRATGRKPSVSSSVVGSPSTGGKSFQDRLFQQRAAGGTVQPNEVTSPSTAPTPELPAAKTKAKGNTQGAPSNADQRPEGTARPPKKKLSKAEARELQERQRAEKAARNAAGGSAKNPAKSAQGSQKPTKGASSPPRQPSEVNLIGATGPSPSSAGTPTFRPPTKKQYKKDPVANPRDGKVVSLFSHLAQFDSDYNVAKEKSSKAIVHPIVISLGIQYSNNAISGGNARCLALLLALKRVIADYVTPDGNVLQRHLTQHIGKQVDYLSNTRPLAASMRTAIRFVKNEIAELSPSLPDEDAKQKLADCIQDFIINRIQGAHDEIVAGLLEGKKVKNGDVILTFARSSIVLKLLKAAHDKGIQFHVIVVDSRPRLEGKDTLAELTKYGISCSYTMTNAVHFVMKQATKVIMGASSVLSNGDVMSRVGTSIIAMSAYDNKVPVMVLCEVYKFSEMVRLDSFVWNEIGRSGVRILTAGNPEELVDISNRSVSERLPATIISPDASRAGPTLGHLASWKEIENLKLLNLTYDITPAKFINMVCCELGQMPSTLALSILRTTNPNQ
ncbi:Eukaryotic translation initiation factor 2B, subunit 4 delta, 67kDa [Kappamyces sp. JEL0680]|nr:Eukaryotic translation initiation factor 2B, subunit 4 delta, 67kDa [Kappamyces sp. JEL0680]